MTDGKAEVSALLVDPPEDGGKTVAPSEADFYKELPSAHSNLDPLDRVVSGLIFFLATILPLFFGGVHEHTWYPIAIIVLGSSSLYLINRSSVVISTFNSNKGSSIALGAGCAFLLVLVLQALWFSFSRLPHPVLGSSSTLHSWTLFGASSLSFVFAFSLFVVSRVYFRTVPGSKRRFLRWITYSMVIVSVVALSQWFYDNGKLLWIFPPDSEFISTRARWPFVNANHLGAFILLTIFPTFCVFSDRFSHFDMQEMSSDSPRRIQNALLKIIGLAFALLLGMLALIGSLSRGSWGGFCIGSLLLTSAYIFWPKSNMRGFEGLRVYSRKKSRYTESDSAMVSGIFRRSNLKYLAPIFLIVAFVFFFRGKSVELFEERVVYGLLYSLEDIRFQMDSDTIGLLLSNPIFGVGFGNWEPAFFTVSSPLLAGLNPEYLHSDPLQFITECGALGVIPLALLAYAIFTAARFGANSKSGRLIVLGASAALLSFVVGTFVEFSFRIPALLSIWTILLAFFFSACEDPDHSLETSGRRRRRRRARSEELQTPII